MGVSAAVTMDTGMFIFCACANAHIHSCLSIKWVDQGVVYPIRLFGLFSYPAWLRNKGVRIIEVLLYYTRGRPRAPLVINVVHESALNGTAS